MGGNDFIWSRGNVHPTLRKIDIFLISSEWVDVCIHSSGFVLPRTISDHRLILLDCEKVVGVPKPFGFVIMWLEDESFIPLLKSGGRQ